MERIVADFDENEVTSTVEMGEIQADQERLAVEEVARQIADVMESTANQEHAFLEETERLRASRDQQLMGTRLLKVMLDREEDSLKDEFVREMNLQNEIAYMNREMQDLQTEIQDLRAHNDKYFALDPIRPVLEEEKLLRQQILEIERNWANRFQAASTSRQH